MDYFCINHIFSDSLAICDPIISVIPARIEYDGSLYHITSKGNTMKTKFVGDEDCKIFLDTLDVKVNIPALKSAGFYLDFPYVIQYA